MTDQQRDLDQQKSQKMSNTSRTEQIVNQEEYEPVKGSQD